MGPEGKKPADRMIRRLRLKLVAVCMLMVTAVLGAVLWSNYTAVERSIVSLSRQVLLQAMGDAYRPGGPGGSPELGVSIGGDRVLLPYFTVDLWGSAAYVTGGTYADLEDTEALRSILSECLAQNREEGTVSGYHLRYLRRDNGLYQQLAFVDMSMERAMLRETLGSYLQIALAALALLLGISVLLSRWAARPVERAWAQQRRFLSDASHELKTPLTVILSNAELMEASPLDERQTRWTDNIRSEAGRMRTLVEEMLTLARSDAMAPAAEFADVSLSDTALDCVLLFEPVAFEAGKPLTYDIHEGVTVRGDPGRLKQAVSVLLDNAVKYGRAGAPIRLELTGTDRQARLTVSNENEDGPIPPERLSRLFERFYRADDSRGEQAGFGLGLSIADAIAREHRGSVKAESDASGTRFTITLPLK